MTVPFVQTGKVVRRGETIRLGKTIAFIEASLFDVSGKLRARASATASPFPGLDGGST
jgi:acyl-coenzyme A thioesterase PaaI-like protein